ncbi:MAG: 5-(carboxyamino)imidazole ribonucleotide synthase [Motiliproteus sp.]
MKVGILGGGQLARMLALAGHPLDLEFVFLDPAKDACAAPLGKHLNGALDNSLLLKELGQRADVVTFEFENVPAASVELLAATAPTFPPAGALAVAQNRLSEKKLFQTLDIPVPSFAAVNDLDELKQAIAFTGLPAVLKTRSQGYDGKGQVVLRRMDELAQIWQDFEGTPSILETFVAFQRELSIISVRGQDGEMLFYPVSENRHHQGVLDVAISRPDDPMQQRAEGFVRRIAEELNYVGVLTLELFEIEGELYANEIAPRVHNSGHWTIEGAQTNQFENHLRAILNLPLGSTEAIGFSAMINHIGSLPERTEVLQVSGAHLHVYGKACRPGRKVGHTTLQAKDEATLQLRLSQLQTPTNKAFAASG